MFLSFLKTFHRSPWPSRTLLKDTEHSPQTVPSAPFALKFCYFTSQTPHPSQTGGFAMPPKSPISLTLFWTSCLEFPLSYLYRPICHSSFQVWLKFHLIHLADYNLFFFWTSIMTHTEHFSRLQGLRYTCWLSAFLST